MSTGTFTATAALDVRDARPAAVCDSAFFLAHEVNQPLAAIMTNAEIASLWLEREPADLDEVREAINCIITNCLRAANVVKCVSEQSHKALRVPGIVDVNDVVETILHQMGADLRGRSIAIRTDLARDLRMVLGSRVQLEQVFSNLITNAIEALGTVRRRRRTLRVVTATGDNGDVRIAVEDSGPGIEPANSLQVFDPRFTTKPGGMGIGLSICRAIVEAHGGRLWATPNVPYGSVFSITIPAALTD